MLERLFDVELNIYVKLEDVKPNKEYIMTDNLEIGIFRDREYIGFIESVDYSTDGNLSINRGLFMTKPDGTKPFAFATNDSERDDFKKSELSKILVYENNKIVYVYTESSVNNLNQKKIIFTVLDEEIHRTVDNKQGIKIISEKESNYSDPLFNEINTHINSVMTTEYIPQLTPKFCFNTNRIISYRLFKLNERNELVSYTEDGKKLILNTNSLARYDKDGNLIKSGVFRVYFSKRFLNSSLIYVDGVLVNTDIESPDKEITSSIYNLSLSSNINYYSVHGSDNNLRVLYIIGYDIRNLHNKKPIYLSFKLNKHELEFINHISKVS